MFVCVATWVRTPELALFEQAQAGSMPNSQLAVSVRSRTGQLQRRSLPSLPWLLHRRQAVDARSPGAVQPAAVGKRFVPNHVARRIAPSDDRARLYSGQFSQSGNLFISAAQDQLVTIFDANSWALQKSIAARDVAWTVTSTDLSPDERFLIYSSISPVG